MHHHHHQPESSSNNDNNLNNDVTTPSSNENPAFSPVELAQIAASDNNRSLLVKWIFTHPGYLKWSTDLCRPDDLVITAHLEALALIDKEGLQGLQNLFTEEIAMCYAILGEEEEFRRWGQRVVQLSRVEDPPLAAKFEEWLEDPPKKFKRWAWRKKQRMRKFFSFFRVAFDTYKIIMIAERPGRRKLVSGQDLEFPIMEDTFQLLFQIVD